MHSGILNSLSVRDDLVGLQHHSCSLLLPHYTDTTQDVLQNTALNCFPLQPILVCFPLANEAPYLKLQKGEKKVKYIAVSSHQPRFRCSFVLIVIL